MHECLGISDGNLVEPDDQLGLGPGFLILVVLLLVPVQVLNVLILELLQLGFQGCQLSQVLAGLDLIGGDCFQLEFDRVDSLLDRRLGEILRCGTIRIDLHAKLVGSLADIARQFRTVLLRTMLEHLDGQTNMLLIIQRELALRGKSELIVRELVALGGLHGSFAKQRQQIIFRIIGIIVRIDIVIIVVVIGLQVLQRKRIKHVVRGLSDETPGGEFFLLLHILFLQHLGTIVYRRYVVHLVD